MQENHNNTPECMRRPQVIESTSDAAILESFDGDAEISDNMGDIPVSSVNVEGDILVCIGTTLVVSGDLYVLGKVTVRGSLSVKGRFFVSKGVFLHGDGAPSNTRGKIKRFSIGE